VLAGAALARLVVARLGADLLVVVVAAAAAAAAVVG